MPDECDVQVADAILDHEMHPAYEVHVGRVVELGGITSRIVSVWLEGVRWSGYLARADPRELTPPVAAEGVHLYYEVMPVAVKEVAVHGLRCSEHGEKTDEKARKADAFLDGHRPAAVRDAGVARGHVVYAFLSVGVDCLVDISTGAVVRARDYAAGRDEVLLRFSADESTCFISDLDLYDQVAASIEQGNITAAEAEARDYWDRLVPMARYGCPSGCNTILRPEVLVCQNISVDRIRLAGR